MASFSSVTLKNVHFSFYIFLKAKVHLTRPIGKNDSIVVNERWLVVTAGVTVAGNQVYVGSNPVNSLDFNDESRHEQLQNHNQNYYLSSFWI